MDIFLYGNAVHYFLFKNHLILKKFNETKNRNKIFNKHNLTYQFNMDLKLINLCV